MISYTFSPLYFVEISESLSIIYMTKLLNSDWLTAVQFFFLYAKKE